MTLVVRPGTAHDHAEVLVLNNAAVPHVNALTEIQFGWLASHVDYFRVSEDARGITGFLLAIGQGSDYWSENYAWFGKRYDAFLYLDRVVVAERARRAGIARALYRDLQTFAGARWPRITLEVNERPPNPESRLFHEQMGFTEVGTRESDDGEKAVVMMERLQSY